MSQNFITSVDQTREIQHLYVATEFSDSWAGCVSQLCQNIIDYVTICSFQYTIPVDLFHTHSSVFNVCGNCGHLNNQSSISNCVSFESRDLMGVYMNLCPTVFYFQKIFFGQFSWDFLNRHYWRLKLWVCWFLLISTSFFVYIL